MKEDLKKLEKFMDSCFPDPGEMYIEEDENGVVFFKMVKNDQPVMIMLRKDYDDILKWKKSKEK